MVVLLVAGCGGGSLTDKEKMMVLGAEAAITSTVANGSEYGDTLQGVDDLIAIYRAKPDAALDGTTVREHLQDMASTLEPYQPDLAAKLDRALK